MVSVLCQNFVKKKEIADSEKYQSRGEEVEVEDVLQTNLKLIKKESWLKKRHTISLESVR